MGRTLSSNFPDGLAGGHKTLGGGQIPFEFITGTSTADDTDLEKLAIESTMTMMSGIFDV